MYKALLCLALTISISLKSFGQQVPATYHAGMDQLAEYISDRVQNNIFDAYRFASGTITISFEVDTNGRLQNARLVEGMDPTSDTTAITALLRSGRWEPASIDGKKVKMRMSLPLVFSPSSGYTPRKIDSLNRDGFQVYYPKKWKVNEVGKLHQIKTNRLAKGEMVYIGKLGPDENLFTYKKRFKQRGFGFEPKTHELAINGNPTRMVDGRLLQNEVLEGISSPYRIHMAEMEACDERYLLILFYFEEDKNEGIQQISYILESFRCI